MSEDARRKAETRLAAALEDAGLADSREDYRERLRLLRRHNATAFREATDHYQRVVLPGLLESPDPLRVWIEFGIALAGMGGAGRTVSVDETGHGRPWDGACSPRQLLLFLPDDRQAEAMAVAVPGNPSPAQAATVALLVEKKLSL